MASNIVCLGAGSSVVECSSSSASGDSFLGATSSAIQSLKTTFNCIPRIAALELQEPALGASLETTPEGVHAFVRETSGDVNIALHWSISPDPASTLTLPDCKLWSSLGVRSDVRAVVSAVPDALVPYVERGLQAVGRIITFKEPCRTWQPKQGSLIAIGKNALKVASESSLPPGFTLCELTELDAVTVNDAWKYKTANSITMVKEAIALRPSVGVKDSMGNLAAWAVLRADLSWGLLATREDVRRKGLGKAVMIAAFSRQEEWARGGQLAASAGSKYPNASELALLTSPYVHIKTGNEGSEGLFAALDFEPVAYVTWVLSSRCVISSLQSLSTLAGEDLWLEMLTLINTSYRADDAFFVDQERTDKQTLLGMAREGEFFTARDELTGI